MNKIAIVYWSSTGNTEEMAQAIFSGAKAAGAAATLLRPSEFSATQLSRYDSIAFGCPAMGNEVLEETEFEPMFSRLENSLLGIKLTLFGSYGRGDGLWMKSWCERCKNAGAILLDPGGLITMESPDEVALTACEKAGRTLAGW